MDIKEAVEILEEKVFNYRLNKKMGIVDKMTEKGRKECEALEKVLAELEKKDTIINTMQAEFERLEDLEDNTDMLKMELKKKDKIINEMSNHIATTDSNLCEYLDMTTKCKYYAGENKKTCDNCIKEYFKKKVEE